MIREPAPAKINLYLHVTGRRDDGYHLLDSLVAFCGAADFVSAAPADSLHLSVIGPFAGAVADLGERNVALRAARALARLAHVEPRAALTLDKRLPVAAGIGGGSADAAATLRALTRLWRLPAGPASLRSIARELGADVPACVETRPVLVSAIGDRLKFLDEQSLQLPLVLVNPGRQLLTSDVFRSRTGAFSHARPLRRLPTDADALIDALAERRNDLEPAAVNLEPAIALVLDAIAAIPGCRLARMSGSGATCFGVFHDAMAARSAATSLKRAHADWWIVATSTLPG